MIAGGAYFRVENGIGAGANLERARSDALIEVFIGRESGLSRRRQVCGASL
jgi:hypothetical protein